MLLMGKVKFQSVQMKARTRRNIIDLKVSIFREGFPNVINYNVAFAQGDQTAHDHANLVAQKSSGLDSKHIAFFRKKTGGQPCIILNLTFNYITDEPGMFTWSSRIRRKVVCPLK